MQEFTNEAQSQDRPVLEHIRELVAEEQRLLGNDDLADKERLHQIQVELDQYWDLLRQRRALRDVGENPEDARLRDPDTVENYEN